MSDQPEVLSKKGSFKKLHRLQTELVRLQEWIVHEGLKLFVLLRAATPRARAARSADRRTHQPSGGPHVALGIPTDRENTQWYFQRYVEHLPAGGEIVLFDRSWYNRAGVEHVMGFCTDDEYREFLRSCPRFEGILLRSGIVLMKYWFSVTDEEQERRFQARLDDPRSAGSSAPTDLEARARWVDYAEAKDKVFAGTDTEHSPWFVVEGDDKRSARLNLISHLLDQVPYERVDQERVTLPPRQKRDYERPPASTEKQVPERFRVE